MNSVSIAFFFLYDFFLILPKNSLINRCAGQFFFLLEFVFYNIKSLKCFRWKTELDSRILEMDLLDYSLQWNWNKMWDWKKISRIKN